MYAQKAFKKEDLEQIDALIRGNPLANLIIVKDQKIRAMHLPLLAVRNEDSELVLSGHVSRRNEIAEFVIDRPEVLAIFQGPNNYVSPSYYPSKIKNEAVVPTWNYISVHAHGEMTLIDNESWILNHLDKLTQEHEKKFDKPWSIYDAPKQYVNKMTRAVIGIEIVVSEIEAVWKLSQNKAEEDFRGVVDGFRALETRNEGSMSKFMMDELNRGLF